MTSTEAKLLNLLQAGIPFCSQPYKLIGEQLGLTETETIEKIKVLKDKGIIRRLSGIFDRKSIGLASTLVAAKVPKDRLTEVVAGINALAGVTHNYLREENDFNVWFTLMAENQAKLKTVLNSLKQQFPAISFLDLPSVKVFKINAQFKVKGPQ